MTKPLYLFVGRSASGKSTVANLLERIGEYKQLQSYTTREPRYDGEVGHIFITNEEFDQLENIVAYTEYNNCKYCATQNQIDAADIYVIDVPGVKTLLEKYTSDRQIVVVYFNTDVRTRIDRMINRHDSDTAIVSRLYTDEEFDWERELQKIVWHYQNYESTSVDMYVVDANKDLENVLGQVTDYIKENGKEN